LKRDFILNFVEVEHQGGIMTIRMNHPDRLNALGTELCTELKVAWEEFYSNSNAEVAIFTGTGRAFCAGGDLRESAERLSQGREMHSMGMNEYFDPLRSDKPIIAAINGYAMGGGFILAERCDLRVAVQGAVFEMSAAKRSLLGGYSHGLRNGLPHAVATEMAFSFRFSAERLYELGFINRLTDSSGLMPTAREMAQHLLDLPPAARVNTLTMMRALRPGVPDEFARLGVRLKKYGAAEDLLESRIAFAEKRRPNFKGWENDRDRELTPNLASIRKEG
jgi:enoyl-CoA hydratase/carnithine racemase